MNEENRHEELQALKRDILSSLHCALPGTVVSFDAESQTAVIQPAVKHRPMSSRAQSRDLLRRFPFLSSMMFRSSCPFHLKSIPVMPAW